MILCKENSRAAYGVPNIKIVKKLPINSPSAQGLEHFYKIRSVREKSARWSPKRENKKDHSFSKMEITALHLMEEKVIS